MTNTSRETLIDALRNRHLKFDTIEVMLRAADMLEADAQEIEHTRKMYEKAHQGRADFRQAFREAMEAQQVAVLAPDMFWNHDDAEKLYGSISEFLNDEMCNDTELAIGDIRTVQRAVRLPNIDIRITSINEDECDADYEIVEAQGAKP